MKKLFLLIAVLITLAALGYLGSAMEKPATAVAGSGAMARPWGLSGSVLTGPMSEAGRNAGFASAKDGPPAQLCEKYYVTSDFLNVRSGPGTDYSVLGSLTRGMKINVISMEGDAKNRWAKFRFEGLTAYALASHLSRDGQ